MREYSIYWVEEEFAYHYFHKTSVLYDFFASYKENPQLDQMKSQFRFVTKYIPLELIVEHVSKRISNSVHLSFYPEQSKLRLKKGHQKIELIQASGREIKLYAENIHQAEVLIFDYLRSFHHSFFISDEAYNQFGWIAPIKKEAIL
ncbi:hypothetical protein N781_11695 [Pontibacillus halophilus JSM 076056 = DSM 19796]|uniref:Sporulation inhibitor of replication protein SirA n=1 Tax=Pontibacillus halophilus JSM 076056 = DSM 19796 TaxID=1385510 RepID=A0A0A5GMU5_9BACI|nr:sporulation inhibitor of replication protein SirA [Pontibacillus halophilus]KGX93319.1 hypothetical protein N781_11695 [Pontibacillus halophilus JSM 076056 = DSM 19796]